jgi:DNA-directed RNA polymerase subunit K
MPRRRHGGARPPADAAATRFLPRVIAGPGQQFICSPGCGGTDARVAPPGAPGEVDALEYTRFEKARIIGARALQLSMGAPPLIEIPPEVRNPVRVAMLEYDANAIPLTVKRTQTHQVRQ